MTKALKILIYLNTDEAHIKDIATYVYGNDGPEEANKVKAMIRYLKKLGWKIRSGIHNHHLTLSHYSLIHKAFGGRPGDGKLGDWDSKLTMSSANVTKAIK